MKPKAAMALKSALFCGAILALAPYAATAQQIPQSGTTRYVTHFVFHPISTVDIPGLGQVTTVEMVGPTENMDGGSMLDKMQAKCEAVKVDAGPKKYIDGACALTDRNGNVIFSTFDTRDIDKALPAMNCGTHIIIGGTGPYAGITGREPFACIPKPTPPGQPAGSFAMDIPHVTSWEIRRQAISQR